MEFADVNYINKKYKKNYERIFENNIVKNQLILGNDVNKFETDFSIFNHAKFCKTVNSGYDALYLALLFLRKNTKKRKVIVQSHSFYASFSSIIAAGFEILALDTSTCNFNLDIEQLKHYMSDDIAAVLNVRLYGISGNSIEILKLCKSYNAYFIEDCAQSHGIIEQSKKLFNYKKYAQAYSFYPTKNLGALGDGGAVLTNDKKLADFVCSYRDYGKKTKFEHKYLGINSRMDTLQASILRFKLKKLNYINSIRRKKIIYYSKRIDPEKILIKLPYLNINEKKLAPHVFPIFPKNKNKLIRNFKKKNIVFNYHYPYSIHNFKDIFGNKLFIKECEISVKMANNVISVPFGCHLKSEEQDLIIDIINN